MIAPQMSPPSKSEQPGARRSTGGRSRSDAPKGEQGVLSNLPSTRPQRPSARRATARRSTAAPARRTAAASTPGAGNAPTPRAAKATAPRAAKAKPARTVKPRPLKPPELPVPRQGFEAEEEIQPGHSVQPPSGAELAVSIAELFGELAQTGISTGERLLKDTLARLTGG
jgi:hypothetical protein